MDSQGQWYTGMVNTKSSSSSTSAKIVSTRPTARWAESEQAAGASLWSCTQVAGGENTTQSHNQISGQLQQVTPITDTHLNWTIFNMNLKQFSWLFFSCKEELNNLISAQGCVLLRHTVFHSFIQPPSIYSTHTMHYTPSGTKNKAHQSLSLQHQTVVSHYNCTSTQVAQW